MNEQPITEGTVYIVPYRVDGHPSFEYLYQGTAPAHIIHARSPDLAHKVRTSLELMEDLVHVRVLDWNEDSSWTGDGDENFLFLLSKYGRRLGSDEFTRFRIYSFTDIALDQPWTFDEYLEPNAVRYDGSIDLLGYAIGRGGEQLPSQRTLDLGQARSLWTALQWQANPGLDADFAISLRLFSPDGAKSHQKEIVLEDSNQARTRYWKSNKTVDTLFHLNFQNDLEPGENELLLIVYDAETLTPTVEIDVWKPEVTLACTRFEGRP